MSDLEQALSDYLQLRRSLGHQLAEAGWLLPKFVAYLQGQGQVTVTVEAALAWAQQAPKTSTGRVTSVGPHMPLTVIRHDGARTAEVNKRHVAAQLRSPRPLRLRPAHLAHDQPDPGAVRSRPQTQARGDKRLRLAEPAQRGLRAARTWRPGHVPSLPERAARTLELGRATPPGR